MAEQRKPGATDGRRPTRVPRAELAEIVAGACDELAAKWWDDRRVYRDALERDPWWEEPSLWLRETRPPVRTAGEVLAKVLEEHEPGERVGVEPLLEWIHRQEHRLSDAGERRFAHGFYRAGAAIRDETGYGWGEIGEVPV